MSDTRYLIVKGAAGLGNRLCSLANAIEYARRTDRVLLVDWSDGMFAPKGVNAFPLFFELSNVRTVSHFADIPDLTQKSSYPTAWGRSPEKSVWDLYRRGEGAFVNSTVLHRVFRRYIRRGWLRRLQRRWYPYSERSKIRSHTMRQAVRSLFSEECFNVGGDLPLHLKQDVVFHCDYCPPYDPATVKDCIHPSQIIQDSVSAFCKEHAIGRDCIGVHVRMTDLQPSQPLTQIESIVKRIPIETPRIFLATDSDRVEEYMRGVFSKSVTIPKVPVELPRGMGRHYYASRQGCPSLAEVIARESVMDMFLLSRCEYLVVQAGSSFGRVAAILRDDASRSFCWGMSDKRRNHARTAAEYVR